MQHARAEAARHVASVRSEFAGACPIEVQFEPSIHTTPLSTRRSGRVGSLPKIMRESRRWSLDNAGCPNLRAAAYASERKLMVSLRQFSEKETVEQKIEQLQQAESDTQCGVESAMRETGLRRCRLVVRVEIGRQADHGGRPSQPALETVWTSCSCHAVGLSATQGATSPPNVSVVRGQAQRRGCVRHAFSCALKLA
eukprot:CAMPEP_0183341886 /NCGR_PEP_ID=MMETSP0164_2-20130417/8095_1 /TAXON_ID=221442 /ORGANISM="Coccolithus pelagicus ssp braarudi, Strain PLY182g" /LENGTH=196 /DNA_ID=CAMNT_0025512331 /DNA_START=211 /DNA_END=799 /DNA_ORIENTATION=+